MKAVSWRQDASGGVSEALTAQIDGVERILSLEPRSRVQHLFCGRGLQTLELARRGYRVLGLDIEQASFAEARQTGLRERLNVHFMKADPRQVAYRSEYDAVVCLSSTFGRFSNERDDLKTLEAARKGLKAGGKLLLDLPNKERLMREFEFSAPGEAHFDFETGRLAAESGSLRVYVLTELKRLIAQAGLSYLRSWGSFDGSGYGMDSPRMIVLAERPVETPRPPLREEGSLVSAIHIKGRRKSPR